MITLRDTIPSRGRPVVTILIVIVNVMVFLYMVSLDPYSQRDFVSQYAVIPARLHLSALFTMMFLHGGWMHIIGNMWFLWVFGNNVEDSMGHVRFLVFYLLCGIAAAGTQTLVTPASAVPMVGASGAISGVMGAYVVLYPRVRVHMLVILGIFITRIVVPAYLMLGYWFLLQLIGGGLAQGEGGVAFWAHAGGFVAGALLIHVFRDPELVAKHQVLSRTTEGLVYRER